MILIEVLLQQFQIKTILPLELQSHIEIHTQYFRKSWKKIKISKELKIFKNRQNLPKCYDMTTCFYILSLTIF